MVALFDTTCPRRVHESVYVVVFVRGGVMRLPVEDTGSVFVPFPRVHFVVFELLHTRSEEPLFCTELGYAVREMLVPPVAVVLAFVTVSVPTLYRCSPPGSETPVPMVRGKSVHVELPGGKPEIPTRMSYVPAASDVGMVMVRLSDAVPDQVFEETTWSSTETYFVPLSRCMNWR
jgi:hypothetical protein